MEIVVKRRSVHSRIDTTRRSTPCGFNVRAIHPSIAAGGLDAF
jgi:hypothetical protein